MNWDFTPVDKFGRRWPEIDTFNRRVWLCSTCGQLDLRGRCNHEKMPVKKAIALGGKVWEKKPKDTL